MFTSATLVFCLNFELGKNSLKNKFHNEFCTFIISFISLLSLQKGSTFVRQYSSHCSISASCRLSCPSRLHPEILAMALMVVVVPLAVNPLVRLM